MAVIQYRFSSEKSAFREISIDVGAISVADLKVFIAEKNGLGKEFARKLDLKLFNEDETLEYKNDCQMIQAYAKIIVQRTAWVPHEDIKHQARTTLTNEEWKTAEDRTLQSKKKVFPSEFVCRLCSFVIEQPMIVKCTGNCGLSACRDCIENHTQLYKICPFCNKSFSAVIRNKRLEQLINSLDLNEFDCPRRPADFSFDTTQIKTNELSAVEYSNENGIAPHPPSHFLYLLSNKNLDLLRKYDIIIAELLSNLSFCLFNADATQDIFIIPCTSGGGGTSYAIGGFIRVSPLQRVDPESDIIGMEVMKLWDIQGGENGAIQGSAMYRVNWLEKYGRMPMLPSRKQPLYALLNNNKRHDAEGDCSRLQLGGALEIQLEQQKYEEISSCIEDYIKFGSRPTEPFQYPSSRNCEVASVLENDGYHDRSQSVITSNRNLTRDKNNNSSEKPFTSDIFSEIGLPGGPSPLGLDDNIDKLNPYIGYCAILPFLTEEQFKHVRKLQKKSKKGLLQDTGSNRSVSRKTIASARSKSKKDSRNVEQSSDDGTSVSSSSDSESCSNTSSRSLSRSSSRDGSRNSSRHSISERNINLSSSVSKHKVDKSNNSREDYSLSLGRSKTPNNVAENISDSDINLGQSVADINSCSNSGEMVINKDKCYEKQNTSVSDTGVMQKNVVVHENSCHILTINNERNNFGMEKLNNLTSSISKKRNISGAVMNSLKKPKSSMFNF